MLDGAGLEGHPHMACAGIKVSGDDFADNLVAGDNARIARRQFAFYDVQIGAADAASENSHQNVSWPRRWSRDVFNLQRKLRDRRRCGEDSGLHGLILCAWPRHDCAHHWM